MVRAIAGTLLCAGRGELNHDAISEAIETGVRPIIAATAPACGLTLISVKYS
jgi:tRNA pseudouridine38-40 synthase